MGKSNIRKRLEEVYPQSFYNDCRPIVAAEATLVVIDSMQVLKGLIPDGKTGRELGDRMLLDLKADHTPKTFVFTFDCYPFVSISKSITQSQRTEIGMRGEARNDLLDFKLSLDEIIPDSWSQAVQDRNVGIPTILRFFVKHWLTKDLGENIILYLDGHYLHHEDIEEHDIGGAPDTTDPLELLKYPLKLENGKATFVPHLKNELGEGDFAIPFFLRELSEEHHVATVLSIDTDLISILLWAETGLRVNLRYWPRLSFVSNSNGYGRMKDKNQQKWIAIDELKSAIYADQRLAPLEDPLLSLLLAMAASGGDYIDPFSRVTPQRFIDTLLVNAEYIGDIVDKEGVVQVEAYKRLVRCACMQAKAGNKKLFLAVKGTDFSNPLIPSPPDLLYRRKHTQYYFSMIYQSGRSVLALENPRLWGYARVDRDRELVKGNIKRLHGTEAPDDFEVESKEEST